MEFLSYRAARAALRSGKVVQERILSNLPDLADSPWRRVQEIPSQIKHAHLCGSFQWRLKPGEKPAKIVKKPEKTYIGRAAILIRYVLDGTDQNFDWANWAKQARELLKELGK